MRADAMENYSHILATAREALTERGTSVAMREIARRAGVNLATLLRHFPTREALLDALLRQRLQELTDNAEVAPGAGSAKDTLISWLREGVDFVQVYSGAVTMMAEALANQDSALHASCDALRKAGERLLVRAQEEGTARPEIQGRDLFALMGALGWIGDQQSFKPRAVFLFEIISKAILMA